MKSLHSRTVTYKIKNTVEAKNMVAKDPLHVYCRLRPMLHPNDISCMRIVCNKTVLITPPESAANYRNISNKIIQTSFSRVFGTDASQKEVFDLVAVPLIKNLINGKNSLLFTYGVTGGGKTYTMTGTQQDPGIMPRTLNVIFNSIADYQAKRHTFKPDKLNSFEIQSEADARKDRQDNSPSSGTITTKNGKSNKRESRTDSMSGMNTNSDSTESLILTVDEDSAYSVFLTYVEIYNNSVYDLLEETDVKSKTLQSKIIREDGSRNMYVHGVTEIEVKSSEEAFQVFQRGQHKKHVAHTALNAESSRSHSVFTIKLVQAPLDCQGEHVIQDKRVLCVSQLSLVDLAGSERTNRSKNSGQRLREAGNINNSLMTLRTCLEFLRENQIHGANKMVPYRDSKLTHLFKNYFDGEGQVTMIVCINPRADDYDETIQAMKFAEMTQEVQIARPVTNKLDIGYAPGRRNANKIFRDAQNRLEKEGYAEAADLEVDLGLVYSLGGPFPNLEVPNPHNDQIIKTLMRYLEQRIVKRNILRTDLHKKQCNFRDMLVKMERENVSLKIDNSSLRAVHEQQRKKITALEVHLQKSESHVDSLLCKLNSANDAIRCLQQELKEKDTAINKQEIDKLRVKLKYNSKIQTEAEKMNKEFDAKLQQQREDLQEKEKKIKLVKKILVDKTNDEPTPIELNKPIPAINIDDCPATTSIPATSSSPVQTATTDTPNIRQSVQSEDTFANRQDGIPVVNPRYRRSKSADTWLDHRPGALVPLGTIFQPYMQCRRSVTQLRDPKDITDRTSRYCLVAQEQNTDGELETKLYKGDILPTSGGGAQVVFNDMERLKQSSPIPGRKRSNIISPARKNRPNSSEHCLSATRLNSKRPRV